MGSARRLRGTPGLISAARRKLLPGSPPPPAASARAPPPHRVQPLPPSPHSQDLHPPKDACVKVRVLRNHGQMALSHSAKVSLVKGSVHNMQCSEAEPLIRKGVLQVLDANC
jgi:hypothetical protein